MKINHVAMIQNFVQAFHEELAQMDDVETYENAKTFTLTALGMVNGMVVYSNTLVKSGCDNDLLEDMDRAEDTWYAEAYGHLACWMVKHHEDPEKIARVFEMRDKYEALAKD